MVIDREGSVRNGKKFRNGSLLARPRPPQRDWHHVGADASRHSQRARASEPRHAHDVRVHRRRGVRAGRQAARDGRPRDAGQPGRPRPPRARVPRGHQGPPRFVENPRNPRTFPTPEEMKKSHRGGGRGGGGAVPTPARSPRRNPSLGARAEETARRHAARAPRGDASASEEASGEPRGIPKSQQKGKTWRISLHTVIRIRFACPRRDGPGARVTFSHSRARPRRPPQNIRGR